MITRQQLEIINRRILKYPLHIAEKDYFLALALHSISQSGLGEKLVFKGGTALHHCYLEQGRFSEDLDFSSNGYPVTSQDIETIFTEQGYFKIKKQHLSPATLKIEKLQYSGPLIQPNSLKVEIDFFQNVLLPARVLKYRNAWGVDFSVKVMDIREICAEKIRAASQRSRYRDFYDLFLLLKKYPMDLKEITGYIKQKEIREPITKSNMKNNWLIIRTQKEAEMSQIYYSAEARNEDIETMIEQLPFTEIKI